MLSCCAFQANTQRVGRPLVVRAETSGATLARGVSFVDGVWVDVGQLRERGHRAVEHCHSGGYPLPVQDDGALDAAGYLAALHPQAEARRPVKCLYHGVHRAGDVVRRPPCALRTPTR
jgi:hypothetical protein